MVNKHKQGRQSTPAQTIGPARLDERRLVSFYVYAMADAVSRVAYGKRHRARHDVVSLTSDQLQHLQNLWRRRDQLGWVPNDHQDSFERVWRYLGDLSVGEASALITCLRGLLEYGAWPRTGDAIRPISHSLKAQREAGRQS